MRYYLQESARLGRRPDTLEELFNLRYSQLRNVVERAFGRLKGTFRIHRTKPCFGIATQVKVIYTIAALMNWLVDYGDIQVESDKVKESKPGENNFIKDELYDNRANALNTMTRLRQNMARDI